MSWWRGIAGGILGLAALIASGAQASSPFFLFFDRGSAAITAQTQAIIDNAAQTILNVDTRRVVIEGYTDREGSMEANMRLSLRRAEAVRAALVARGVPADRISVRAMGEDSPLTPTEDGVSEQQNRLVLVFLHENCRAPGEPRWQSC